MVRITYNISFVELALFCLLTKMTDARDFVVENFEIVFPIMLGRFQLHILFVEIRDGYSGQQNYTKTVKKNIQLIQHNHSSSTSCFSNGKDVIMQNNDDK